MSNSHLYTKTGDQGQTSLYDGSRVSKTSPQMQLLGNVDELVSQLGYAYCLSKEKAGMLWSGTLRSTEVYKIQSDLMAMNTWVATDEPKSEKQRAQCAYKPDVDELEKWIDKYQGWVGPLRNFIHPEGYLPIVRCTARKVERHFWHVYKGREEHEMVKAWGSYLNRLSDYLFIVSVYDQYNKKEWKHPVDKEQ